MASVWIGGYIMRIQAANTFYTGTYFVFEIEYSVTVSNEIDGNSDNHRIDGTATELEQYIYNRNIHNYHRRNGKLILGYIAYCFR